MGGAPSPGSGSKRNLDIELKYRKGWWTPADDHCAQDIILHEVRDLDLILPHCSKFRSCIQAGGNIGIWSVALAKKFDAVYTAEPDAANYYALLKNTMAFPNIKRMRAALGDREGNGRIHVYIPGNIGAHQVLPGTDFPIITIDSLGIADCDLLQLDVEGYEHLALLGATKTIAASSPVLCIELKGLGENHGYPDLATIAYVERSGYTLVQKIHSDLIFVKEA